MDSASPLRFLQPTIVWAHFQTLCDIPRVSKHEAALRDHLRAWAAEHGLATLIDAAGNLIIRKPATPGMEDRAAVVLQGHLDMVCQKNNDTDHDFFRDPIRPVLRDGWLIAEQTTLGSDNGIGVALALAALESDDFAHGPLEVLLTVDEEAGMGGAQGLAPGLLQGELMINIDTEEWGHFYLGCAGGLDVAVNQAYELETVPTGHVIRRIAVSGLCGGHSGIDIHRGRGHAIKLLVRLLRRLEDEDLRVVEFSGGTARNALPREAEATVAVPAGAETGIARRIADFAQQVRDELAGVEKRVDIAFDASDRRPARTMKRSDQHALLSALHAAPQGVRRMSTRVADVVETSDNLGVIRITDGHAEAVFMVRSLIDSAADALADEIRDLFSLVGARAEKQGAYPGWKPNPDSALLTLCQEAYAREFGGRAEVKVIHAGLECGIIGAKYPRMDMISFGPDIMGAHAPGERVNVESVERCWVLLKAILAAIPPSARTKQGTA